MKGFSNLWKILFYPRRTSRDILENKASLGIAWVIILVFAAAISILFLISHFKADYPPPPEEFEIWIEAWGEFAMLPVVPIAAENYRLTQAIFMVPLVLTVWVLMAGSARVISRWLKGKVTFKQYFILFGFTFFPFWIIGHGLDIAYSAIIGDNLIPALQMEFGPIVRGCAVFFPAVMWTGVLCLGGIYNGIVTFEIEETVWWKAALTACATFVWPILFISMLIR